MDRGAALGYKAIQRMALSSSLILVNALSAWTEANFGRMQGLWIAFLVFVISMQLNQAEAQPRLLKRVSLLYCNQQLRKLFVIQDITPLHVFSNILLAVALAVLMMMIYSGKSSREIQDLQNMLEGLLYLYSDICNFAFQYGTFKITAFAFGASTLLSSLKPPSGQINAFCWRLASMISVNLLTIGTTNLIQTTFTELAVLQCLASVSIMRLAFPSMESYLTYMAAMRLLSIVPNMAPLFFCVVLWLDVLPASGQGWVGDTCFTYVIASVGSAVGQTPFWGTILILVISHYIDYVVQMNL